MKTCPFCAEQIQDAAILCKHCGQKLESFRDERPAPDRRKTTPIAWFAAVIFGLVGLGWCASLVSPPPDSGRATSASAGAPTAPPTQSYDLALLSSRGEETSGYHIVQGEVENLTSQPIRSVVAVASWYDTAGQFITSDDALIDFNPILPGQKSPFKTMSRTNPAMAKYTVTFKQMMGGTLVVDDRRNKPAAAAKAGEPAEMFQVMTGTGDSFYHGASCKRVVGEAKYLSLLIAAKTLKPCPTCKPPLVKGGLAIHQ